MMKPLLVANWKCNPNTLKEARHLFNFVKRASKKNKKIEVVICPPFIYLSLFKGVKTNIKLGAQDVFWEKGGAFTGEISPLMLKDLKCKYVIVGHSERRRYFKETDETVNKKLKAVIEAGLTPILCVGETKEQRNRGETEKVLRKQIQNGLKGISKSKIQNSKLCIAYEPIWAIGTGNACGIKEAKKVLLFIKKRLSFKNRILYGGSVNSKNSADYIKKANFQGLLVGGASLDAKEFIKIVKATL